ncbi:MAG: thiamine pyrophosphate-binding protein [Caldisericia bacterium]
MAKEVEMNEEMKVSDYIVKFLETMNVRYVYGYIGGSVTHLFDSLSKSHKIEFVQCYHEQAAAFGASASAKLSGNLSVALATSGPGATNLVTGIADAYFDSSPVLFITGQVNTYDFKYDLKVRQKGFQETDIVKIVTPITKYSVLVDDPKNVESELKKAVAMALNGRKGPVLLDLPMDIQRQMIGVSSPSCFAVDTQQNECLPDDKDIDDILQAISSSKSPVILAGGGCSTSDSKNELLKFAEISNIPVVVSLMGKDGFPHNHRLFGGFIGAYGNRYGNILLARSDLLIVLGSRLDSRQIGNEISPFLKKGIIRVDIDKDEIESSQLEYRTTLVCDVKQFLKRMNLAIEREKVVFPKNEERILNIQRLKERFDPISEMRRAHEEDWHYRVMKGISDNLADDDIVCVDVGQNQMLAAQVLSMKGNQRFINSGGMAPMGYALPAAVALSIETKKRIVVITGDGGMQINIQELNNVASRRLPITIFVFNNKSLGMIKQFQKMYFNANYFATDEKSGYNSCNFTEIARAYGIGAIQIQPDENAIPEVARILQGPRMPLLVEFVMDYESYVYPKLEYDKPIDKIDPPLDDKEKKFLESMSLENRENRGTSLDSSEPNRGK